jgi:hypothetical protein
VQGIVHPNLSECISGQERESARGELEATRRISEMSGFNGVSFVR